MHEPNKNRPIAVILTVLSGLARLLPHPPNFTPVGSMSLFAGARVPGWLAYALPILIMAITDPLVGGYSRATPFVYAAFLINVWIGRRLQRSENPMRIGGAAFLCSLQFFLLSNLGVWLAYQTHTLASFEACYIGAIPFWGRTLAGDLFYTAVIFGLHSLLSRTVAPSERPAVA